MTAADRDDDFETFLQRRSLLSQGDDRLEPPGAVDEAVLRKAHAAVQGRRPATRAARWAMPVGLAATILLCLSIVLNVVLNTNRSAPVAALRQAAPARDDTRADGEGATALREDAATPGESESRAREEAQVVHENASLARDAVAARAAASAPVASAAIPATTPSVTAGQAPSSAPRAVAQAYTSAQQELRRSAAPLAKREASAAAAHPLDPKVWLQQIQALRNVGKTAEADAEMKRFRSAFPAYPVTPPSPDPPTPPR